MKVKHYIICMHIIEKGTWRAGGASDFLASRACVPGSIPSDTACGLQRKILAEALVQLLKLPAWKVGDRGFVHRSGVSKKQIFLPRPLRKIPDCGELPLLRGSVFGLRPSYSLSTYTCSIGLHSHLRWELL